MAPSEGPAEGSLMAVLTLEAPPEPPRPPARPSPLALARYAWHQLTSMRTALLLLFLLALAAVPGSLLPQRGVNPLQVGEFFRRHPTLAPLLDRFSLFDVFAAPWFAAIYLLLVVSLAGCALPRTVQHVTTLRARPPAPPRNLSRLPAYERWETDAEPAAVLAAARRVLRGWRVDGHPSSARTPPALAAERGHLRTTGNLLFHLALLVLLAGVAIGGLFGYRGTVLVKEGEGFANALSQYDNFRPGRVFRPTALTPFAFVLDDFRATYQEAGPTRGAPRTFDARVRYRDAPDGPLRPYDIRVNHPLRIGAAKVYLIGHGYAPRVRVTDGRGAVVFDAAVPFLPQDANFTSNGVVKVPDARPEQLGFSGFFTPTTVPSPRGLTSAFPAARNPALVLLAWSGDLGLDSGIPQSVYTLDTDKLTRRATRALGVGDRWQLPDGLGTVTFTGHTEWATFQVTYDPGKRLALVAALLVVAGLLLSLSVRRRRVWVRADRTEGGRTVVEIAGVARTGGVGVGLEVRDLARRIRAATSSRAHPEGE
ncbi:MAG TPA: cytochrome c biogenesis protein ResB [Mycobacteriales bacterium]|nr:cytochrome c biogenesis protein ResB [Mycobacteriales bacterium]